MDHRTSFATSALGASGTVREVAAPSGAIGLVGSAELRTDKVATEAALGLASQGGCTLPFGVGERALGRRLLAVEAAAVKEVASLAAPVRLLHVRTGTSTFAEAALPLRGLGH